MKLLSILVVCLIAVSAVGCALPGRAATDSEENGSYPVTVTDDLERSVTITSRPERIVSLAPSNTEIVAALGGLSRLVGITDSCNYPREVEDKERLGMLFDAKNTNFEAIVALEPDLALAIGGHPEVVSRLEELGIVVYAVDAGSIDEVLASIEMIGRLIGAEEQARTVVDSLTDRVAAIEELVAGVSVRPRVLFEIWPEPLMSAGPGSFIAALIEIAGGDNIASVTDEPYPTLSREIVIAQDPQVILTTFPATVEEIAAGNRPDWLELSAVVNDRVVVIDEDMIARPGPRIVDALEAIVRALHPDLL